MGKMKKAYLEEIGVVNEVIESSRMKGNRTKRATGSVEKSS